MKPSAPASVVGRRKLVDAAELAASGAALRGVAAGPCDKFPALCPRLRPSSG